MVKFWILLAVIAMNWMGLAHARSYGNDNTTPEDLLNIVCPQVSQRENGFQVRVPFSYQNPSLGTTQIYAHFLDGFDRQLPTVVFVMGGPGSPSHLSSTTYGDYLKKVFKGKFNYLEFDQRGIGCSYPQNKTYYTNPEFYSSVNTARDIDEIRKALKIEKWTVWGGSYGTVPATIYGSLFKSNAKAIVLEGVLFEGIRYSIDARYEAAREIWELLDENGKVNAAVLRDQFDFYLTEAISANGITFASKFASAMNSNNITSVLWGNGNVMITDRDGYAFAETNREVHVQIACKELVGSNPKGKIVIITPHGPAVQESSPACEKVNTNGTPYAADNFPIQVPTTYLQGMYDIRTPIVDAKSHYNLVAKSSAYFLNFKFGGHAPTTQIENSKELSAEQKQIFESILLSAMAGSDPTTSVQQFNSAGDLKIDLDYK